MIVNRRSMSEHMNPVACQAPPKSRSETRNSLFSKSWLSNRDRAICLAFAPKGVSMTLKPVLFGVWLLAGVLSILVAINPFGRHDIDASITASIPDR